MKSKSLGLAAVSLFIPAFLVMADNPAAPVPSPAPKVAKTTGNLKTQLDALVARIRAKLDKGDATEAALAPELKGFDDLMAAHAGEKTDLVAEIPLFKAMLYVEVFQKPDQALAILKKIQEDYPGTQPAKIAAQVSSDLGKRAESIARHSLLKVGEQFPDFAMKDLDGKPLSVAGYKGKIVLVDFWATWCGPCVGELPNVQAAYAKYHAQGFEIIGISLDEKDDRAKLVAFLKDRKMPWPQFYDGLGWHNELAVKYGIESIPASYLLDRDGKIIAADMRGDALAEAVGKALAAK